MTLSTMTASRPDFNHVIAFEVSKSTLIVHILPGKRTRSIATTATAVRRLLRGEMRRNAEQALGPMLAVCEATGGYARCVLDGCEALGIACHQAHGTRVRRYAQYRGALAKTDTIDAAIIADFGLQTKGLRLYRAPRKEQRHLRELKARRDEVQAMLLAERNRLAPALHPDVRRSIESLIAVLKDQLTDLEKQIKALIAGDQLFCRNARLMQSLSGVGPLTAATVLAYLPEIGQLTRGQVAAITGLAPINRDSGTQRAPRHIAAGRAEVRRCLYRAAVTAIQHNPVLAAFAQRLKHAGKPFKVVATAVMRKIIVILNAIVRQQKPWTHHKQA